MTKHDPVQASLEWMRQGYDRAEIGRGLEVHCGITDSIEVETVVACATDLYLAIPEAERSMARPLSPEEQAAKLARKKAREREKAEAERTRILERGEYRELMASEVYDAMWCLPRERDSAALDDLMAELQAKYWKKLGAASFTWAIDMACQRFDREKERRKAMEPAEPEKPDPEPERTGEVDLHTWPHLQMQ